MKNTYFLRDNTVGIVLKYRSSHKIVWIDKKDFTKVAGVPGTWGVKWNPTAKTFYARLQVSRGNNRKIIYLHRFLLNITDRFTQGDHKDHNGLNNRRRNLRATTRSLNGFNRRGAQVNTKSKRRNVYWNAREQQWMVWLVYNGHRHYAGYFKRLRDADLAARDLRERVTQ